MSRVARIVPALLLLTGVTSLAAQRQDSVMRESVVRDSKAAAMAGLDTMRLLARENFQALGFKSAEEAAVTSVGEPVVIYDVRLDSLRAYAGQADASALLTGGGRLVYPILSSGRVASSIEVDRRAGVWKPVSYGGATFVSVLFRMRTEATATSHLPESAYFLVRVPGLAMYFLGAGEGTSLSLIPLVDDQKGRWKAGAVLKARDVLSELVADAKASNGLPI